MGELGGGGFYMCNFLRAKSNKNMQIYSMYYWTKNVLDLSEFGLSTIILDYLMVYIIYRRGLIYLMKNGVNL